MKVYTKVMKMDITKKKAIEDAFRMLEIETRDIYELDRFFEEEQYKELIPPPGAIISLVPQVIDDIPSVVFDQQYPQVLYSTGRSQS